MSRGIRLEDLSLRVGPASLLSKISLNVEPGSFVGIVGPNGAGKTSLLRAILRLVHPTEGKVKIAGEDASAMSARSRAGHLGWLPQQHHVLEPITILESVAAARFRFDESRAEALDAARMALATMNLAAMSHRTMDTLSGGEGQRVALAALLAQDSEFMLLDEPANHLDPAYQAAIYAELGAQWRSGRGVLCVTHDINLLRYVAPPSRMEEVRVLGIKEGRVTLDANMASTSLADDLSALFDVPMTRVAHGDGWIFIPGAAHAEGEL